jgi:hypothetical protein
VKEQRFVLSAKDYVNKGLNINRRNLTFDEARKIQDELSSKGYDSISIRKQRTATPMGNPSHRNKLYSTGEISDAIEILLKHPDKIKNINHHLLNFLRKRKFVDINDRVTKRGKEFISYRVKNRQYSRKRTATPMGNPAFKTKEGTYNLRVKESEDGWMWQLTERGLLGQKVAYEGDGFPSEEAAEEDGTKFATKLNPKRKKSGRSKILSKHNPGPDSTAFLMYAVGAGIIIYLAYQYYQNQLFQGNMLLSGAPSGLPVYQQPPRMPQSIQLAAPDYGNEVLG